MFLAAEKGIREGIWYSVLPYAKANKHMKNYDENKGASLCI